MVNQARHYPSATERLLRDFAKSILPFAQDAKTGWRFAPSYINALKAAEDCRRYDLDRKDRRATPADSTDMARWNADLA